VPQVPSRMRARHIGLGRHLDDGAARPAAHRGRRSGRRRCGDAGCEARRDQPSPAAPVCAPCRGQPAGRRAHTAPAVRQAPHRRNDATDEGHIRRRRLRQCAALQ
jgi:hypothetical protein